MSEEQQKSKAKEEEVASKPPATATATETATAAEVSEEEESKDVKSKKKEGKKKAINPNIVIPPKKPKLSKAERRALQEAQRAAKASKQQQQQQGGGGQQQQQQSGGKKKKAGTNSSIAAVEGGGDGGDQKLQAKKEGKEEEYQKNKKKMPSTLSLFSHLPQYEQRQKFHSNFVGVSLGSSSNNSNSNTTGIGSPTTIPTATATAAAVPNAAAAAADVNRFHPAVLSLGLQYANGSIRGGNNRAKAMLRAFQCILRDYTPPSQTQQQQQQLSTSPTTPSYDFRQDIDLRILKPAFQYWTIECRPHSVSMGNAFTFLKTALATLDRDILWTTACTMLCDTIDSYIEERIVLAGKAISAHAQSKLVDGDVILTYGRSDLIETILCDAAAASTTTTSSSSENKPKPRFRVIIVDSRPLLEGRILLHNLTSAGIQCTYVLFNALSYVMMTHPITKVLLGASALMSNGSVLSRVGTACIALMARKSNGTCNNVPVLFCSESYKLSTRVQLESITRNEIGNPLDVIQLPKLSSGSSLLSSSNHNHGKEEKEENNNDDGIAQMMMNEKEENPNLNVLNLLYDLTPSKYVSGIITEMGILPPTSVAVLLREMNPGQ